MLGDFGCPDNLTSLYYYCAVGQKSEGSRFWHISHLMAHLEDDLCVKKSHSFLLLRNESLRSTINISKLNFVKKTSSIFSPVNRNLKYQEL